MSLADERRTGQPADTAAVVDRRILASLSVHNYRLLFIAAVLSNISVQGQMIARGWLAKQLTDSNAALGGVYLAFGITMLIATPFGGVVADRFSRKRIMAATQIALAASALWIAVAVTLDFVTYTQLVLASILQSVAFAFMGPARMALTSELVGRPLLPNAIVLGQMSMNSARVLGPALAGMAIGIAWIGTGGVYYVAAGFSIMSLLQILRIPETHTGPPLHSASPLREYMDGIAYVREHTEVKRLLLISFVIVMVAFPYTAFLPAVAEDLFDRGAGGYGWLNSFSAVGAVLVSIYVARAASGAAVWIVQAIAGIAFGVGLFMLAAASDWTLALVAVCFIGGAASGFQSMNNSLVLALSDFEYHGRIQSMMMLSFSGFGMAALPIGVIADQIGLRQTFAGMGGITLATMTIYLLIRRNSPAAIRPSLS